MVNSAIGQVRANELKEGQSDHPVAALDRKPSHVDDAESEVSEKTRVSWFEPYTLYRHDRRWTLSRIHFLAAIRTGHVGH